MGDHAARRHPDVWNEIFLYLSFRSFRYTRHRSESFALRTTGCLIGNYPSSIVSAIGFVGPDILQSPVARWNCRNDSCLVDEEHFVDDRSWDGRVAYPSIDFLNRSVRKEGGFKFKDCVHFREHARVLPHHQLPALALQSSRRNEVPFQPKDDSYQA